MWQPGQGGGLGENGHMYIYMAESLRYSPKTITTLLITYIPIQNKSLKFEKIYIYLKSIISIFTQPTSYKTTS